MRKWATTTVAFCPKLTGAIEHMADNIIWTFSPKLLEHIVGKTPKETEHTKKVLQEHFIGKELHKRYDARSNKYVYLIGHTNRAISVEEFNKFVNSGLIVSKAKEQNAISRASERIAHQIVGNTADIPINAPEMSFKPDAGIGAASHEQQAALPQLQHRKRQARSVSPKVATPQFTAAKKRQPITVATPASAPMSAPYDIGNTASFMLEQTGMMQALDSTTFFDQESEPPQFKPFEADEPKHDGLASKVKGIFHRKH